MEQYKIEYWREALSISFEEVGAIDMWNELTFTQEMNIIKSVINSVDCQSMAFGYVDTRGADSYQVTELKRQLADAKKEAQQWQDGFISNVSKRHPNWEKHEIYISKDGNAGNKLNF